jgi:hypothetical protein
VSKFSVGSVIICDEVRREITNKDILIGVYSGAIVVSAVPATLTVAVWIELIAETGGPLTVDLKITLPSDAPPSEFRLRMSFEVLESTVIAGSIGIFTPSLQCEIPVPGNLEVSLKEADSESWRVIKTKKIIVGEVLAPMQLGQTMTPANSLPTASPLPSEQSLDAAPEKAPLRARRRLSARQSARNPGPE